MAERRHHGLGIAFGLIVEDRDQIVAVRIFAFDVFKLWPDRAWQVAASDVVAGQAISLAPVEGELLSLGCRRLRASGRRGGRQHECKGGESYRYGAGKGEQGRFRRRAMSMISFEKYRS